jgi:hypothetical protein
VAATITSATGSASTATPSVTSATAEYATAAGTVFADCTSGAPVLAGVPVAGWTVDDSLEPGEMEFEAGEQRVEVSVSCVGGTPVFRLDDRSSSESSGPASSSATSGRDDSSGGDGGGHGADDAPGDDSSGRDGGGHGSDG